MLSSWNMEFCSGCGEESNDQKASKVNICLSPQAKQTKKLGSILNFEKFERTSDDFHPQVLRNAEKSREFRQKQQVGRKLCKSEELVKYMSCTPSYLERGGNPQEKPFNIGVLDWRLLEKWQHNNNGVAGVNRNHSPSTGKTASIISHKGSSSHCSSDNTRPYHLQQINHPSLLSNVNGTPTEGCSSGTKRIAGNGQEFLERKVQQSVLQATQSSSQDTMKRLINSKSEQPEQPKVTGMRSRAFEADGSISGVKGNVMIHKGEESKAEERVRSSAVNDCDFPGRHKLAVPDSTNNPGSRHSAVGHQSDSSKGDKNRSLEENRHTFYGGSSVNVCHKSRSDCTHSYSVAHERGKSKDSGVEKSPSKEIRSLDCPSAGKDKTMPFSGSVPITPSRRKNLEKTNSGSKARNLAENEVIFQMKVETTKSTKVRNPSPTRRISFGIGRVGKSSGSNATANLVSENILDSEVTSTSACPNSFTSDKSNAPSKARSSPLRRLLDPLLKTKGHDVARSSKRNPLKIDGTLKSSSEQIESPALDLVKGKLGQNSCGRDDIGGPDDRQKNGTSSVQAILQVAVKNGLPLFTFTVDNCTDILAATVKETSCEKTKRSWIYTFFSFREMKKKNAHWMNQGSKDSNRGYISKIVGQMKASDILYAIKSSGREFVFSSMGARDGDLTSDLSPGDELAAVIVKFPEGISGQIYHDGLQRGTSDEQSRGPFPQVSNCSNLRNESANDGFLSTIVILPGGHHGVPSKGEPSPLIERWKAGGSCDCGGWDLGCQLRILANSNQSSQGFKSMKSQSTAFKLFSQEEVEVEEQRPMFILSPFEDGIFSVEFDSSLKLVQAFSIGIAVLSTRTSAVLSSNMCGGKMFDEITAPEEPGVSKIVNQVAPGEICANYISNPPLSPVGRV